MEDKVFICLHIPQGGGSTILGKLYEELPLLFPVFPTYLIIKSKCFSDVYEFIMHFQWLTKATLRTEQGKWSLPNCCLLSTIVDKSWVMTSKSCRRWALSFDRLDCVLVSMYCLLIFPMIPSASMKANHQISRVIWFCPLEIHYFIVAFYVQKIHNFQVISS